jgi:hypothetical protein
MLWGCNPRALSDPVSRCQLALPHHPLASSPVHRALQRICSSHVTDLLICHFWKFGYVKGVFMLSILIYWAKMYVGESKIICNIGTCFAVGYTAGWA